MRCAKCKRLLLTRKAIGRKYDLRYVEEAEGIHHESAWARRLPDALRFLLGQAPVAAERRRK